MNRQLILLAFSLASLVGCQYIPAMNSQAAAPESSTTGSVASRVEQNIAQAGIVAPTGIWVQEEPNGIVALHGLLNDRRQVIQAEEIAKKTPGVTGVRNVLDSADTEGDDRP